MKPERRVNVAVLLATYNGARFVEQQLRSLTANTAEFVVYWLDDHSTDNTREVVHKVAHSAGIGLQELHQSRHGGVPGVFFDLLEQVEADIYLFCDQDDIWQPGKIDAAVADLMPDLASPVLCFSDLLMFRDHAPQKRFRLSEVSGANAAAGLNEARLFMSGVVAGNTQAFTLPLRDMFLTHQVIARTHAIMHDTWMHLIAVAAGQVRLLPHAPTTLYRVHNDNASGAFGSWRGAGAGHFVVTWHQHQVIRRALARQAKGFMIAAPTLPAGRRLQRLLKIAELIAVLDRRQSLASLVRLARLRALWPSRRLALGLALTCLCGDATTEVGNSVV
jgi:rhamnosyltransferase